MPVNASTPFARNGTARAREQSEAQEPMPIVPNQWYGVVEARSVGRKPLAIKRFGENLLLYRDSKGNPVCMLNQCPHRGMQLTHGRVFGDAIECPFHGFQFNPSGACITMPCEGKDAHIPRLMRTVTFPAQEEHGIIWIWWGASAADLGLPALPPIPWHENLPKTPYISTHSFVWPMPHHRVIENSVDAHHAPLLHGQRRGWRGWKVPGLGRKARNDPFHVEIVSGGIDSIYHFRDERAPNESPFRTIVDYREPGIAYSVIGGQLHLITIDTPIDDYTTWRIIRYFNAKIKIPVLGSLIAHAMRVFDQAAIQWHEDFWVINSQQDPIEGVIDHHYIKSDRMVAEYYALQRRLMKEAEPFRNALPEIVKRHFPIQRRSSATTGGEGPSDAMAYAAEGARSGL